MSTPHQRPSHRAQPPSSGEPPGRPAPPTLVAGPGGGLSAPAGAMLAATVEVLCRDEHLGISEIGDHTDLVAEVADALSALTDRLARDLTHGAAGPVATRQISRALHAIRDGLHEASSKARHCADELYRAHVESGAPPGS